MHVRSGEARLAVERVGEGRLRVILLHAGVADRRSWRDVTPSLARTATVIAYDRRGYGETEAPPEPHAHVADLVRVLDEHAPGPAWLVGSSQGGRIALDLALAQPERVAGLVLVSPAVSGAPEPEDLPPAEQELADALEAAEERDDLEEVNRLEARIWLDGPEAPEERVGGPARELFLDMNGRALAAPDPGPETEPPGALARLDAVAVPTLLVWGDLDLHFVRERSREVAGRIPGAGTRVMAGTAHLPYLERPDEFAALVAGFLG